MASYPARPYEILFTRSLVMIACADISGHAGTRSDDKQGAWRYPPNNLRFDPVIKWALQRVHF